MSSWFRILVVAGCGFGLGDAEALVAPVARPRVGLAGVPRAARMLVELASLGYGLDPFWALQSIARVPPVASTESVLRSNPTQPAQQPEATVKF